jgi:dolichyl-phosphate beta-glucosyltransferase
VGREGATRPTISVIVPGKNEGTIIAATVREITEFFEGHATLALKEVIVVDDGSTDGMGRIVEALAVRDPRVTVLTNERNRGKGWSVRRGVLYASGELVLFSDADLSTPIDETDRLYAAINEGADVAIASRALRSSKILKSQPFYRVAMGKTFNLLVQALLLPGIWDSQCGFKLFKAGAGKRAFQAMTIERFSFDVEFLFLAKKAGYVIREIPVRWIDNPDSRVHLSTDVLSMMKDLIRIRLRYATGKYRF